MAVPFNNEEDESEEQIQRLHQLFAEFVQVLTQILEHLQQPPPAAPVQHRLASCGDAQDEEDDDEEPPSAAAMPLAEESAALPDVVPRPAPRLSLARPAPQPAPRHQAKYPANSPFTKYLTEPRVAVAVSRSTCCFKLPNVVPVDPAPIAAPSAAPTAAAPMAAAKSAPSPAPRRLVARTHPSGQASRPRRRPSPTTLAAELAASAAKLAGPAWLRQRDADLEEAMKPLAVASRNDHWVAIGHNLRDLADHFEKNQPSVDVVDAPTEVPRTSLLRMLLPLVPKGSLESKFITTAILLYCGYSYFRR